MSNGGGQIRDDSLRGSRRSRSASPRKLREFSVTGKRYDGTSDGSPPTVPGEKSTPGRGEEIPVEADGPMQGHCQSRTVHPNRMRSVTVNRSSKYWAIAPASTNLPSASG